VPTLVVVRASPTWRRDAFIGALTLVAALVLYLSTRALTINHVLPIVALGLCSATLSLIYATASGGHKWDLSAIPSVVALVLLPAPVALWQIFLGTFAGELLTRRPISRVAFNSSQLTLSYLAATAVVAGFGGPAADDAELVGRLHGIALAIVVQWIVNAGLTSVVIALDRGGNILSIWWRNDRNVVVAEFAVMSSGVLLAFGWLYDPRLIALFLVPAAGAWLSVARGRAIERHAWHAERLATIATGLTEVHGVRSVCHTAADLVARFCADAVRVTAFDTSATAVAPTAADTDRASLLDDLDGSPSHRLRLRYGDTDVGNLVAIIRPADMAADRAALLPDVAERIAIALHGAWLMEQAAEVETLRAVDRARGELLAAVSHELHPPLGLVVGYGELLASCTPDEQSRQVAGKVIEAGKHLTHLVDDLLDAARLEAGRYSLKRRPTDLRALATAALDAARTTYPSIDFRLDTSTDHLTVDADPARVLQVLSNLLSNAAKYGSSDGTVRLLLDGDAHIVRLAVEDDGPGIPSSERERVFEKFHRARTDVPGLGLGLSIARDLVVAHGGAIHVEDSPAGGARFVVELPLTT
jgi:signal transduction histidine kinase